MGKTRKIIEFPKDNKTPAWAKFIIASPSIIASIGLIWSGKEVYDADKEKTEKAVLESAISDFYTNETSELFIKLENDDYLKSNSNYNVCVKDEESIIIINNDDIGDAELLGTLKEYIVGNNIAPIGYEMVDAPTYGKYQDEYIDIAETYIRDFNAELESTKLEEEYPVLCFDANDLKEAYLLSQNETTKISDFK